MYIEPLMGMQGAECCDNIKFIHIAHVSGAKCRVDGSDGGDNDADEWVFAYFMWAGVVFSAGKAVSSGPEGVTKISRFATIAAYVIHRIEMCWIS